MTKPNGHLAETFERLRGGLSYFRIGARCSPPIHPNTIQRLSYGIGTPRTISAVAKVLGVTYDELAGKPSSSPKAA